MQDNRFSPSAPPMPYQLTSGDKAYQYDCLLKELGARQDILVVQDLIHTRNRDGYSAYIQDLKDAYDVKLVPKTMELVPPSVKEGLSSNKSLLKMEPRVFYIQQNGQQWSCKTLAADKNSIQSTTLTERELGNDLWKQWNMAFNALSEKPKNSVKITNQQRAAFFAMAEQKKLTPIKPLYNRESDGWPNDGYCLINGKFFCNPNKHDSQEINELFDELLGGYLWYQPAKERAQTLVNEYYIKNGVSMPGELVLPLFFKVLGKWGPNLAMDLAPLSMKKDGSIWMRPTIRFDKTLAFIGGIVNEYRFASMSEAKSDYTASINGKLHKEKIYVESQKDGIMYATESTGLTQQCISWDELVNEIHRQNPKRDIESIREEINGNKLTRFDYETYKNYIFGMMVVRGHISDIIISVQNKVISETLQDLYAPSLFTILEGNQKSLTLQMAEKTPLNTVKGAIEDVLKEPEFEKLTTSVTTLLSQFNTELETDLGSRFEALELAFLALEGSALKKADLENLYVQFKCKLYQKLFPDNYLKFTDFLREKMVALPRTHNAGEPRSTSTAISKSATQGSVYTGAWMETIPHYLFIHDDSFQKLEQDFGLQYTNTPGTPSDRCLVPIEKLFAQYEVIITNQLPSVLQDTTVYVLKSGDTFRYALKDMPNLEVSRLPELEGPSMTAKNKETLLRIFNSLKPKASSYSLYEHGDYLLLNDILDATTHDGWTKKLYSSHGRILLGMILPHLVQNNSWLLSNEVFIQQIETIKNYIERAEKTRLGLISNKQKVAIQSDSYGQKMFAAPTNQAEFRQMQYFNPRLNEDQSVDIAVKNLKERLGEDGYAKLRSQCERDGLPTTVYATMADMNDLQLIADDSGSMAGGITTNSQKTRWQEQAERIEKQIQIRAWLGLNITIQFINNSIPQKEFLFRNCKTLQERESLLANVSAWIRNTVLNRTPSDGTIFYPSLAPILNNSTDEDVILSTDGEASDWNKVISLIQSQNKERTKPIIVACCVDKLGDFESVSVPRELLDNTKFNVGLLEPYDALNKMLETIHGSEIKLPFTKEVYTALHGVSILSSKPFATWHAIIQEARRWHNENQGKNTKDKRNMPIISEEQFTDICGYSDEIAYMTYVNQRPDVKAGTRPQRFVFNKENPNLQPVISFTDKILANVLAFRRNLIYGANEFYPLATELKNQAVQLNKLLEQNPTPIDDRSEIDSIRALWAIWEDNQMNVNTANFEQTKALYDSIHNELCTLQDLIKQRLENDNIPIATLEVEHIIDQPTPPPSAPPAKEYNAPSTSIENIVQKVIDSLSRAQNVRQKDINPVLSILINQLIHESREFLLKLKPGANLRDIIHSYQSSSSLIFNNETFQQELKYEQGAPRSLASHIKAMFQSIFYVLDLVATKITWQDKTMYESHNPMARMLVGRDHFLSPPKWSEIATALDEAKKTIDELDLYTISTTSNNLWRSKY